MAGTSKRRRTRTDLIREARRLGLTVRANATVASIEKQIAEARRRKAAEGKPIPTRKRRAPSKARRETPPTPGPARMPSRKRLPKPPGATSPTPLTDAPPTIGQQTPAVVKPAPWVTIVPRSPEWLFAYFRNANASANVLRVHDAAVHDVVVPDGVTHAFVEVTPGTTDVDVELGTRGRNGQFTPLARSSRVDAPASHAATVVDPEFPIDPRVEEVHARALRALGGASSASSADVSSPSSAAPPNVGASDRLHAAPASPGALSRSEEAMTGGAVDRERGFFLEVGTELVVYGRTVPGSTVTICGERVPLRHDGTFSIRMTLPSGVHDFDVRATSPDGVETRAVDVRVTRDLHSRDGG